MSQSKSDVESATVQSEELRRMQKMKFVTYGVAFCVPDYSYNDLSLTVMIVKNPKFRVRSGAPRI